MQINQLSRIEAINWMEQWADRHQVRLLPMCEMRPGERYVGLVRRIAAQQLLSFEALDELLPMAGQLTFEEMGAPPAPAGPIHGCGAGGESGEKTSSPDSNTGDNMSFEVFKGFKAQESLFVAVDQFTVVGLGDDNREKMLKVVQPYLGAGQQGLYGHNSYKNSWLFECGATLEWTEGRPDWCFRVRGRSLQLVGEARHVEFLLAVDQYAHHSTRVDVRLDDYSRQLIDLQLVREARDAGNFVGPRKSRIIEDGRNVGGRLQLEGASYVFGTRDSVRIVIYDKGLESKGLICSNRFEVGYYQEKAHVAWAELIKAARAGGVPGFTRAAAGLIVGAIDFRIRGNHRHLDRMPRLSWWSTIVDKLGSIRVKVERVASTMNSAAGAFVRQWARTLGRMAVIAEAKGHDIALQLVHLIDRGRQGQELQDRDISPMEAEFDPLYALSVR